MIFLKPTAKNAFTLIELVIVITVIAILMFATFSKMPDNLSLRIQMAQRKIQSDIRYAQSLAMSLQKRTEIFFSVASDNYSVYIEDTPGTWVLAKEPATRKDFTVQLDAGDFSGVQILRACFNTYSNNRALVFDKWGNPYGYRVSTGAIAALVNPAYVRLTSNQEVRVERGTGRAYLSP